MCKMGAVLSRGGVEDTMLEAKDTKKSEVKAKDSPTEDRPSRGQGQECSRPRTALPRTDPLEAKDRNARGQGQECSRPRPRTKDTSAIALQKKKKGLHKKFFSRSSEKNVFQEIFQALHKLLTTQKIVLSSSRGHGIF